MFGELWEDRIQDPGELTIALADITCLLHEREEAIGRTPSSVWPESPALPTYPTPSDFDGRHVDVAGDFIRSVRQAIGFMIIGSAESPALTTPDDPPERLMGAPTTVSRYRKADWSLWGHVNQLLTDAGWEDGWEEDIHIENPVLWYQLRDALLQLRWYIVYVSVDSVGGSFVQRFGSKTRYDFPYTYAQILEDAWDIMRADAPGTNPTFPGLGFNIVSSETIEENDEVPSVVQATSVLSISKAISNASLFRGLVLAPWSYSFAYAGENRYNGTASGHLRFTNTLGHELDVLSGTNFTSASPADRVVEDDYNISDLLGPVVWTMTDPATLASSHPFSLRFPTYPYDPLSRIFPGALAGGTPGQTLLSRWRCDAQPYFTHT